MTRAGKKSIIITSAVCALVGICGAVAYFTDRDNATNTFTVGEVDIDLEEVFTPSSARNLAPTATVTKEPYVTNTSTVPTYIFMEVTVPKAQLITAATNGTRNANRIEQLFTFTSSATSPTTIEKHNTTNSYNSKWEIYTAQSSFPDTTANNKYVFVYKGGSGTGDNLYKIPAGTNTEKLFNKVKLANAIEGQGLEGSSYNIGIKTYAIQCQGCNSYTDAYSKYVKQNP